MKSFLLTIDYFNKHLEISGFLLHETDCKPTI
jgi:hypothetical protein